MPTQENIRLSFRVTSEERLQLEADAEEDERRLPEYIRTMLELPALQPPVKGKPSG